MARKLLRNRLEFEFKNLYNLMQIYQFVALFREKRDYWYKFPMPLLMLGNQHKR